VRQQSGDRVVQHEPRTVGLLDARLRAADIVEEPPYLFSSCAESIKRVGTRPVEDAAQHLHPRPEAGYAESAGAGRADDRDIGVAERLLGETCLADAGFTRDKEKGAAACGRRCQR